MAAKGRQSTFEALADAGRAVATAATESEALAAIAAGVAAAYAADAAIVRVLEGDALVARAVSASSPSLAALVEGSRAPISALDEDDLHLPVRARDELLGSLEVRRAAPFAANERALARVAAEQIAIVLRLFRSGEHHDEGDGALGLAGEALAAGTDEGHVEGHIARLAATASGAQAALVWGADGRLSATVGSPEVDEGILATAALGSLGSRELVAVEEIEGRILASARLGEPAAGVLQLVLPTADGAALTGLGSFALRAAQALRADERIRSTAVDRDHARALLAILAEATAELSLSHTLASAIDQIAEVTDTARLAVYLHDDERLVVESQRGLTGPHLIVAEAVLSVLLGPFRGRGIVVIDDVAREPRLATVHEVAAEAGIGSIVALPLVARGEVIGLLGLYPIAGRVVGEDERSLLGALAAQLAVAVQNARAHEEVKELASARKRELDAALEGARRVRALYEVSRSFAQSLSLSATLDALAQTAVELLGVDAAAIRMPDERGELLTTRALHVGDPHLQTAANTMLVRPQPFGAGPVQRLFRTREPLQLDANLAREVGGAHELLVPFLAKGSTAAVVPIATPGEVVATLTMVSFDPGRPIVAETIQTALSIAQQAALAIDNGRLYQQQKQFADTMQRSLLPQTHPQLEGLEIGEVYESSAQVDVGGDMYDFVELGGGKLAVALGDVTGHGIEATADMAMAKFVFRSLSREHSDPGDFLAAANDVVVGEIAPGKFITMTYITVDARNGNVVAACAGHPAPLIVGRDGTVTPLGARGLALGVEVGQRYDERGATLEQGGAVVLYTDGVVEARRKRELYGQERLAGVLSASHALPARELATTVVEDCRRYAGGELTDDCAVVIIKRTT